MSKLVKVVIPKVAAHWDTPAFALEFKTTRVDNKKKTI